jgi:hypothetical protein
MLFVFAGVTSGELSGETCLIFFFVFVFSGLSGSERDSTGLNPTTCGREALPFES